MLLQHLKGCITYVTSTVNAITLAVIVLPFPSLLLWLQVSKSLLKAVPTSETMSEAVIERPNF